MAFWALFHVHMRVETPRSTAPLLQDEPDILKDGYRAYRAVLMRDSLRSREYVAFLDVMSARILPGYRIQNEPGQQKHDSNLLVDGIAGLFPEEQWAFMERVRIALDELFPPDQPDIYWRQSLELRQEQKEQIINNLLVLCSRIRCPTIVGGTLSRLLEPRDEQRFDMSPPKHWRRPLLQEAAICNQIDRRFRDDWLELLGKGFKLSMTKKCGIAGNCGDGFQGMLHMPPIFPASEIEPPEEVLEAFSVVMRHEDKRLQIAGQQVDRSIKYFIECLLRFYPKCLPTLMQFAEKQSFPTWALENIRSMQPKVEGIQAGTAGAAGKLLEG